MAVIRACENCGRPTPIFRLAGVILDGKVTRICPTCQSTEQPRVDLPFAPRPDQGAIQPSTSRDIW